MNQSIDRRVFVKTAYACAAGMSLGGCESMGGQAGAGVGGGLGVGRHIYKSLKWNMIKTDQSTLEKFEMLKELGYDGVEIDSPTGVDKREALAASRATGLPIDGIVNSTHWKVRHSDPDPAVRAQALENMRQAMRDAAFVGADSVLLVLGRVNDPERENHEQVWSRSMEAVRDLLPLAEELKIKILFENVGNGFCESPELFARYVDEVGSPWVGVHFDIGNHIWAGPPAHWIRVLGRRIRKLDIKDRTTARERTLIGEGDAGWADVRKALGEIGYRGWMAAEVPGGDRERLADVLARMNRVIGPSDGRPGKNMPGATRG
ncbi:MAG: sugar phosphate isomerase/epimerase family protein [Planctomycetota bacterium]|jgi:hexulose-6-phosphate isomerase